MTRPVVAMLAGCAGGPVMLDGPPTASPTVDVVVTLDPPPAGEGVQIATGDFEVPPHTDMQVCSFYQVRDLLEQGGLPTEAPLDLHRIQIAYRPGSHHLSLFRVRTILELDPANGVVQTSINDDGPCADSAQHADWPLIANSQSGSPFDWTFPVGVVNPLDPDEWIMVQSHYVNAFTQTTDGVGSVFVNLWVLPPEQVVQEMGTMFASKQSIRVCQSNPEPRFQGTCQINSGEPVHVVGANGHFHSRGTSFEMYAWNGTTATTPALSERFYVSTEWDDPVMLHSPDLDLELQPFGGIWYTCSYAWRPPPPEIGCEGLDAADQELNGTPDDQLDCCYTFGNLVDVAEHCNVFAYYYPKRDDILCF